MTNLIILADGVFDPLHDQHVTYLLLAGMIDLDCEVVVQVSRQLKRVECLSRAQRAATVRGLRGVSRTVEFNSTLHALEAVRPRYYVKGADWEGRLPPEEQAFCEQAGIQVRFVDTVGSCSSTARLRTWADLEAHRGVRALDTSAQAQQVVPFDAEAQGYGDYGGRVEIEGRHPEILAQLCHGKTVLDVGCGPGHLVKMLRERGIYAVGFDPYISSKHPHCYMARVDEANDGEYDVIVCREVLEHIPVREWGAFLHHLFRVARERVYITTRHTSAPAHPFELTTELDVDPSHITRLPQPFVRALCVLHGGHLDAVWEDALDWQRKGRVLVYQKGGR